MFRKHIALLVALSMIVPLFLIFPASSAGASAPYTSNVIVNSPSRPGDKIDPSIAVESNTTIHAVWEDINGTFSRIFYSKSTNGGLSFGPDKRIDAIPADRTFVLAQEPVVAVNSTGAIFVVWSDNSTQDGTGHDIFRLFICRSTDGGQHFSVPSLVTTTYKGNQTRPDIAVSDGYVDLVWVEDNRVDTDIYFARSADGATFSTPAHVDKGTAHTIQQSPSISVQGQKVFVCWHDNREDPQFDIYGAISTNGGLSFGGSHTDFKISDAVGSSRQDWPDSVILPDGRIVVVWEDQRTGDFDIRSAVSSGGSTFGASVKVSDDPSNFVQSEPKIAADGRGIVSVAYRDNRLGDYHIFATSSVNATSFTPSVVVNDNSLAAQRSPTIADSPNGTAYVCFSDNRTGKENIYLSARYNLAPSCAIDYPIDNLPLPPGVVTIAGHANDPESYPGLEVEVRISNHTSAVDSGWMTAFYDGHYNWNISVDTALYANGRYLIQARAWDGASYSKVAEVNATFDNGVQPYVDLVARASDISFDPASPVAGDNVSFSAEIWNLGTKSATNVDVWFYQGNTKIGYNVISAIDSGKSATAEIRFIAAEGTFNMKVAVDPQDKIPEKNETNNNATKQLVVGPAPVPLPDLEVTAQNITYSPSIVHVGDPVQFSVKIYNKGDAGIGGVKVRFEIDGLYIGQQTTDWIPAKDARFVYQGWTPTQANLGNRTLTVTVDPTEETNDSNFSNNQASIVFEVKSASVYKPDLAVSDSSITISPAHPVVGQNVSLNVMVSNVGDLDASNVEVTLYLDGSKYGGVQVIPTIQAGENPQVATWYWTATLGMHSLRFVVDEANKIQELNESNNTANATLSVTQVNYLRPDLSITQSSIAMSPNPPEKGMVIKFNVTVANIGNDSARNFAVTLTMDGAVMTNTTVPFLAAGSTIVVSGAWMAIAGSHTFSATADSGRTVNESSETNNQASVTLTFPADPVNFPWEWVLLAVALVILALGAFAYVRARKRRSAK